MEFPDWVEGPSLCKTRTFSMALGIDPVNQRTRNRRPTKLVATLENDSPIVAIRNKENGKLYPHYVKSSFDPNRFELVED